MLYEVITLGTSLRVRGRIRARGKLDVQPIEHGIDGGGQGSDATAAVQQPDNPVSGIAKHRPGIAGRLENRITSYNVCYTKLLRLPLKALVWQDAKGEVWLGYNDPAYLAKRHDVATCPVVRNNFV